jgi:mannosyltransferase OCH1-like enzyme
MTGFPRGVVQRSIFPKSCYNPARLVLFCAPLLSNLTSSLAQIKNMRWRGFTFGLITLIFLFLLIRSVFTLLALLFEDEFADAIPARELRSANYTNYTTIGPPLIPKIIHQTYKHNNIPAVWREAQQSCIDLHTDYKYIVRDGTLPVLCRSYYEANSDVPNLIVMDR